MSTIKKNIVTSCLCLQKLFSKHSLNQDQKNMMSDIYFCANWKKKHFMLVKICKQFAAN